MSATPAKAATGRVPVFVLTGFLGAGKTSLLNAVLRGGKLANTAVIVNEFGEIGLDRLFLETAGDGVIEMADGCLCCTMRGELAATLLDLAPRNVARVVIETTGLADPVPVLRALLADADVGRHFELSGVVALVDAVNALSTLAEHEEARNQIALADRLVVTKSDLLAPEIRRERFAALTARLRALNPRAPILDRTDAQALDALFAEKIWLTDELPAHAAHNHAVHSHDRHRHGGDGGRIVATVIRHDRPMAMRALEAFLELIASAHAGRVLRIKGIVEVEGRSAPVVIHGVQGIFHEPETLDAWPDGEPATRIVAIVRDMDPEFLHRLFAGFAGIPLPDTPDRQALTDNPLAIAGMGWPTGKKG